MKKTNGLITIAVIGVLLAGAFFVFRQYFPLYGGGYNGYHMRGGMGGMGFMMPFFWILLIAAGVSWLCRAPRDSRDYDHPRSDLPDALEILKQRYAKGEIDKAEYTTKLADIRDT